MGRKIGKKRKFEILYKLVMQYGRRNTKNSLFT